MRQILINARGGVDIIVWIKERNGKYNVKEGYQTIKDKMKRNENVGPSISFKVDNKLWKEI